jgi:hypothetical protein
MFACAEVGRATNACPSGLRGRPEPNNYTLQWGGDTAKVQAAITSVAVECLPVFTPEIESGTAKIPATTRYQLAATANVAYAINDAKFFDRETAYRNLEALAVFEAVSPGGVVLGSGEGMFRVVRGGSVAGVSGTIDGLSDEQVKRVAEVRVRWRYGHN